MEDHEESLKTPNCKRKGIERIERKQMTAILNVAQQTISDRLKATEKMQKYGKWVPHELNKRQMENRKNTCEILLQRRGFSSDCYWQ